ncbi:MAG TPA: hypothetical protein VGB54_08665 [Allosphingosinicella sp.]|jgi:hypothetical protein
MKKSLIIIASALLLAVGAASHHRLRYDSSVFTGSGEATGGARVTRVEYPPCIKGVREDRCIQLYERGVRRSYDRWLARHGRSRSEQVAARGPARAYRPCRARGDDNCRQHAGRRHVRVLHRAGQRQVHRRAAASIPRNRRVMALRSAPPTRARPDQRTRTRVVRTTRQVTVERQRTQRTVVRQQATPPRRGTIPSGTPGI